MPLKRFDPRTSDRWSGPGAAGRWLPGVFTGQSPLFDAPRSKRQSYRGLYNEYQAEWLKEKGDELPGTVGGYSTDPNAALIGGYSTKPDTPLVQLTGSYADPIDFNSVPTHSSGSELRTLAEDQFVSSLGNSDSWQSKAVGFADPFTEWMSTSQNPLAKGIRGLDGLAEGAERVGGFLYQAAFSEELQSDIGAVMGQAFGSSQSPVDPDTYDRLAASWQAGHLTMEALGVPRLGIGNTLKYVLASSPGWHKLVDDEEFVEKYQHALRLQMDHWTKAVQGIETTTGGLPALVKARTAIVEGADPEAVYEDYWNNLNPGLIPRAQWSDMVGHMTIDPLNYIGVLGLPKASELLHVARQTVRMSRLAPDVALAADDMATIARFASGATELAADVTLKYGNEAIGAGFNLTDAGRVAVADDLLRAAAAADIEEITKPAQVLANAIKSGGDTTEAATKLVDNLSQFNTVMNRMSPVEQKLFKLLGGDPFTENPSGKIWNSDLTFTENVYRLPANLLTPRARATAFVNQMSDNVRMILSKGDDPVEWIRRVKSAAEGSFSSKFGHIVMSPIGRHVQGVLRAWADDGVKLLDSWEASTSQRNMVNMIAQYTGSTAPEVIGLLNKSEQSAKALLDVFTDALAESTDAAARNMMQGIEAGDITAEYLSKVGATFKKTKDGMVPYTPEMFRAMAAFQIAETSGKAAVAQFGVKTEGWVNKIVNVVKASESALLLGLNPKYPIQNFFNNEFTMLSRGLFSGIALDKLDDMVWRRFGMKPVRAGEDFTLSHTLDAGLRGRKVEDPLSEALIAGSLDPARRHGQNIVLNTIRGDGGKLDNIATRFSKGLLNGKDFRLVASRIEKFSSERAAAAGMLKAWNEYIWMPGKGFSRMDDVIPGLSERLRVADPEFANFVYDVITDAKRPEDLAKITELDDLRITADSLFRRAGADVGLSTDDLRNFMDTELFESFRKGLQDLGNSPDAAQINKLVDDHKALAQNQIDEWFIDSLPARTAEYAAMAATEGPRGVQKIFNEVVDRVYERQFLHAKDTEMIVSQIRNSPKEVRSRLWDSYFADTGKAWDRTWRFTESAFEGIKKGLDEWVAESGAKINNDIVKSFKSFRAANDEFFKFRTEQYSKIRATDFKSEDARRLAWDEVDGLLDDKYDDLINTTNLSWKKIDQMFIDMVGDSNPAMQDAVYEWRRMLRNMRVNDMRDTAAFRKQVRGLQNNGPQWQEYWQQRINNYQKPVMQAEALGAEIFNGNSEVITQMQMLAAVSEDYTDIRIVDLMSSSLTNDDIIAGLERLPGGRKLLGSLGEADNFDEALTLARDRFRVDEYDTLLDQVSRMYPVGSPDHIEMVNKVARLFNVATATESGATVNRLRDIVNKWWRGEYGLGDEAADIVGAAGRVGGPPVAPREVGGPMRIGTVPIDELDPYLQGEMYSAIDQAAAIVEEAIESGGFRLRVREDKAHMFDADDVTLFNNANLRPGEMPTRELTERLSNMYGETGWVERYSVNPPEYSENYAKFGMNKKSLLNGIKRLTGQKGFPFKQTRNVEAAADLVQDILWNMSKGNDELRNYLEQAPDWITKYGNEYKRLEDIPLGDVAKALRDRAVANDLPVPNKIFSQLLDDVGYTRQGVSQNFIPDLAELTGGRQPFPVDGLDDLWQGHTSNIFERMRLHAQDDLVTRPLRYGDIPQDMQDDLMRYIDRVEGQMMDARITASNIGMAFRDSALLNYNQQYRWDAAISTYAPFAYWWTHSSMAWLAASVDRPAVLAAYFRMYKFMNTAVGDEANMPSRLRGQIKIKLPFAPDFMGDTYTNPFRWGGALPFKGFLDPFVRLEEHQNSTEELADKKLNEMVANGEITADMYEQAITQKEGSLWLRAMSLAQDDESLGRFDPLDFMNMTTSPHIPIQMAWNAARGTPQEGFGILPGTRTARSILGAFDATDNVYDNTWGNMRRHMGLHGYDSWDDYRIDRELANLVAEGEITIDDAMLAMFDRNGEAYELAKYRSDRVTSVESLTNLLGIPVKGYPEGEKNMREMAEKFYAAIRMSDAGDATAVRQFFDQYPEYEVRLALWKEPEERMRQFMTDRIYDGYNNLGTLNKNLAKEHMPGFKELFLDRDTRDISSIPLAQLGVWLKQLRGPTPAGLGDDAMPIAFVPKPIADQVQVFYDFRNNNFPNFWSLQQAYNDLEENTEREEFRAANPELDAYWNWADKEYPGWRDTLSEYFDQAPDSARDLFLKDYPELQQMWDRGKELFPEHSMLSQQYANTPEYLKRDFLRANPQLAAYWNWRSETLPNYSAYYDYYFKLSGESDRDRYLDANPELSDFFDDREYLFGDISELTRVYATLPGNDARMGFINSNPELKAYWDWRNNFLTQNPNLAPYIDDGFEPNYGSAEEREQAVSSQPNFTWMEWQFALPMDLQIILLEGYNNQEALPIEVTNELESIAGGYGLDADGLLSEIYGAIDQAQVAVP